jgi:hypothetical protein
MPNVVFVTLYGPFAHVIGKDRFGSTVRVPPALWRRQKYPKERTESLQSVERAVSADFVAKVFSGPVA